VPRAATIRKPRLTSCDCFAWTCSWILSSARRRCSADVQAEEKARKAFEKVKAKYDSALQDLQEAQAELDSTPWFRAKGSNDPETSTHVV
jgi:hypothetical protein